MEIITSLTNKKVKYWNSLNEKKYRDQEGVYLVEGEHLVLEALRRNLIIELIASETYQINYLGDIYYVSDEVLKKISRVKTPQKVMAVVKKQETSRIGDKILLIDDVQDPGNLGTIIRSAVAFNLDTIILGKNCVDLYNNKVIRSSEGMIFNIDIQTKDLTKIIPLLKDDSYTIIGTKVTDGQLLEDYEAPKKWALIVGNEGNGVKPEILNMCDDYLYIKMNEQCESLNVGVATSIILYKLGMSNNE